MAEPRKRTKLIVFITVAVLAFVIGIVCALWYQNTQARARFQNVEVTFLTPQQAIVFWKTPERLSVGFARFGTTSSNRDKTVDQTSSEPSEVHAVMLEDVPPDGFYLSIHEPNESRWLMPEIIAVKYSPELLEGGGL